MEQLHHHTAAIEKMSQELLVSPDHLRQVVPSREGRIDALNPTRGTSAPSAVANRVFRTELNPVDFLRMAGYVYPEKIAVVDGERRYSYGQLAERSWRLANALRSAGLCKGDRVATLLF